MESIPDTVPVESPVVPSDNPGVEEDIIPVEGIITPGVEPPAGGRRTGVVDKIPGLECPDMIPCVVEEGSPGVVMLGEFREEWREGGGGGVYG